MKLKCLVMFMLSILISCKDRDSLTEELVAEKLSALLTQYNTDKNLECEKYIQDQLDQYADSILIVLSKKIKYDSLTIPYDSIRPEKPMIDFPEYKKPEKPE
ncbi:MAG: hypothetical protein IPM34_02990 [Saprospiraceae bacterium]|nr:hypothetical protein [Saprospiraceae bacterium]